MSAERAAKPVVVVLGAEGPADLPGVEKIEDWVDLEFAGGTEALRRALPRAEILLGWDFRADQLEAAWQAAARLKWIHWSGAGVDAVLFEGLRRSDVVLTNARGLYDRAMAEYVLGLIIAQAKHFPQTFSAQRTRRWAYQMTEIIEQRRVLVAGVGSIGRCIARLLSGVGMRVEGVGRTARVGDADFARVHAVADLDAALAEADFVVAALPLTEKTRRLFARPQFQAMKRTARFINVGRGASVDEAALIDALEAGDIAGAALDVFETEPLPEHSPLWRAPNLIVSPHMSGDFQGYHESVFGLFVDNLHRYRRGEPLRNVVDKRAGFVTSP